MSEDMMPPEGQTWLRTVEHNLATMQSADRMEIIDGLRAHILDALDGGDNIRTVLGRLGTPSSVADQAILEYDPAHGDEPPKYLNAKRVLQFTALGLTVVATLIIGFLPSYTATSIGDDGRITSATTNGFQNLINLSPYFVSGTVLALLLTVAPLLVRGRAWTTVSIVSASSLAVVAAASVVLIGNWLLVPPAVVSILAAILRPQQRHARATLMGARA